MVCGCRWLGHTMYLGAPSSGRVLEVHKCTCRTLICIMSEVHELIHWRENILLSIFRHSNDLCDPGILRDHLEVHSINRIGQGSLVSCIWSIVVARHDSDCLGCGLNAILLQNQMVGGKIAGIVRSKWRSKWDTQMLRHLIMFARRHVSWITLW